MVKKIIIFSMLCCFILFMTGCVEGKGVKEKSVKGYESVLLFDKEYKGTSLEKWIKSCVGTDGYFEFINSDPDSWDMYIYYPNINPKPEYISYKVDLKINDSILKIYISKQKALSELKRAKDLVLKISAPLRGAWPTKSEVYIDGDKVKCIGRI